jgi:hypothetical protein
MVVPPRGLRRRRSPTGGLAALRDTSLPMTERLLAAEQLENRGMGKPKETVETVDGKTEVDETLDRMPTEDPHALVQRGRELPLVQGETTEHQAHYLPTPLFQRLGWHPSCCSVARGVPPGVPAWSECGPGEKRRSDSIPGPEPERHPGG